MSSHNDIVFDFDCTLAARHLYHVMHSGGVYITDLLENKNENWKLWDAKSKRVVERILLSEEEWGSKDGDGDGEYGHISGLLDDAMAFSYFIFGGEKRVSELKVFLESIPSCGAKTRLHISTKGILSDVKDVLCNLGLLSYFTYMEGFDNHYEDKLVYRVGKGWVKNLNTYFARARDIEGKGCVVSFIDKPAFLFFLAENNNSGRIVYMDDDDEYYEKLKAYSNVVTISIGVKEQYYKNEVPNLCGSTMTNVLKSISELN